MALPENPIIKIEMEHLRLRTTAPLIMLALTCGAVSLLAQASQADAPRFEVASVRLSKNPQPGGDVQISPGRFRGKDLALQWLILTAYRIKSNKLAGDLPDWTLSERYDIDARMSGPADETEVLAALRLLLQDRFVLREHREFREEPVYFLTVAKGGAKMPAGTCVSPKQDLPNQCYSSRIDGLVQTIDWRGVSISAPDGVAYRTFAWQLPVDRPVIDKTGLTGTFDIHLRWAPEPRTNEAAANTGLPAAPSIFDALQEQLGLKLEPGRGPVEYMIVDHAEKPASD